MLALPGSRCFNIDLAKQSKSQADQYFSREDETLLKNLMFVMPHHPIYLS